MVMIRWPIPYGPGLNGFEIVGRYIAQVIAMERFIDMILLHQGQKPRDLKRMKMASKITILETLISAPELDLSEWNDLPEAMKRVAQNRNLFAHRLFERGAMPTHYGQGIPYEELSDDELAEQERDAFMASEACRQLVAAVTLPELNPGMHFGRTDPDWSEVLKRHAELDQKGD